MYPALVKSIVVNMNLNNREQLEMILDKAAQPNPEDEAMKKEMHAMAMAKEKATVSAVEAQAYESRMRGENYKMTAEMQPQELEIKRIDAVTKNLQPGAGEDTEFVRRLKIAETALKERDLNIKEKDMMMRHEQVKADREAGAKLASIVGGS